MTTRAFASEARSLSLALLPRALSRGVQTEVPPFPAHGRHTLVVAPVGSGRDAFCFVPHLLTDEAPVIVQDMNAEFSLTTAATRAKKFGNEVVALDPTSLQFGASLNLLDFLPADEILEGEAIKTLIAALFPRTGAAGPAYTSSFEHSLWCAAVAHVRRLSPSASLQDAHGVIAGLDSRESIAELATGSPSAFARERFSQLESSSDNWIHVVLGATQTSGMFKFFDPADPVLSAMTSRSSFDVNRIGTKGFDLYLVSPSTKVGLTAPFFRALLTMWLRKRFETIFCVDGKVVPPKVPPSGVEKTNLLLPELASLEVLDILAPVMVRSCSIHVFGVRVLAAVNTVEQLRSVSPENSLQTFLDNIESTLYFTPTNQCDARALATLLRSEVIGRVVIDGIERVIEARVTPEGVRCMPFGSVIEVHRTGSWSRYQAVPYFENPKLSALAQLNTAA